MLNILPQRFYESPDVSKLMVDGNASIIHKKVYRSIFSKEGYVSTHAITAVLKGTLRVELDNHDLIEVRKDQMIFLPKGLYSISDIVPDGEHFEAMVFFFSRPIIDQFLAVNKMHFTTDRCISNLKLDFTEKISTYIHTLLPLYGEQKNPSELTHMKLFEFLHLIHSSVDSACIVHALSTLSNKEKVGIKSFMETHFHKPLTIEDYAYLTGRSVAAFRRDFKRMVGTSPKKWLIEKRLSRAHELLKTDRDQKITDVAYDVGYINIPHFIKAFHKKYNITPKQLLMKHQEAMMV